MPAGLPLTGRRLRWILAGVVLATIVARLPVRDPQGGQAHLALAQELVACAGGAIAAAAAVRTRAPFARDPIARIVIALLAIEALSSALAANPWMALRASAIAFAGAAVFFAARASGGLGAGPLAVGLVVAASVVLEALGVVPGWSRTGHAPGGVLGERNAASELLVCLVPAIVAIAVRSDRARTRAVAVVTIGASVAAIVLTRTRSAWLALTALAALGLGLALRTAAPHRRARAVTVLFAAAVGVVLATKLPIRLAWTTAHPYRDTLVHLVDRASPSGAGRLAQWSTTFDMARAHPLLGVGPGNWADRYLAFAREGDPTVRLGFAPTTRVPASDVLGYLAERGFVAGLLVAALAWALTRREAGSNDAWLRRATLLAALVVGAFDAALQLAPHLLTVAWIFGAASPTSSQRASGARSRFATLAIASSAAVPFAAARVAAFVLATSPRGLEPLDLAARLDPGNVPLRLKVAETWIEAGDCARARVHLEAAARFAAESPAARDLAARCP